MTEGATQPVLLYLHFWLPAEEKPLRKLHCLASDAKFAEDIETQMSFNGISVLSAPTEAQRSQWRSISYFKYKEGLQ